MVSKLGHFRIVGDDDQRGALLPAGVPDQLQDFTGGLQIQVAGGLIGEQDLGRRDQRPGDAHALLLAAGHAARRVVHVALQSHGIQHLRGALAAHRPAHAAVHQRRGHVVQRALGGKQVEGLEYEADVLQSEAHQILFIHALDALSGHPDRSARGLFQPGHHVQQRGLAGARTADDAGKLAGPDLQTHAVQRAQLRSAQRIDLYHIAQLNGGRSLLFRLRGVVFHAYSFRGRLMDARFVLID